MTSTANHRNPNATHQPVWIDDGGRVTCAAHAGHYLASAIANHPTNTPTLVRTPLGTWEHIDLDTAAAYDVCCEGCEG